MSELMPKITHDEPLVPLPTDEEDLKKKLADHEWRLFSGCLYKIMVKGDDQAEEAMVMPFRPNRAQRRFITRLWHRNLILKARQLGFTTLIAILWLDHALFNADQRCGIIAQDRDAAKVIFRDKVKFAYTSLPEQLRTRFLLGADNADELLFAHNNSSIRVATSMRSGMSAIDRSGEPVRTGRTDNMSAKRAMPGTDQTQTEAFKRWFAGSRVVDADGKPLVVYHGTKGERTVFEPYWKQLEREARPHELAGDGSIARIYRDAKAEPEMHFFAEDRGHAESYGEDVVEAYLSIDRMTGGPDADRGEAIREMLETGADGAQFYDTDANGGYGGTAYVVRKSAQVKSAIGNNGDFDPDTADIRFRSADMGSRAGMASKARDELNRTFSAPGKLSWWHKSVGTMYDLAERSPEFKPVFDSAQGFVDDVSYYATDAADLAPKLLPKLETWRDIAKRPISAADNAAVAKPVFEGTLDWARDESGKPVRLQVLLDAAEKLTPEQKARRLLRNNKISEGMLKAWQGLPLEQYEKLVASRYESQMLKAGIVWTPAELKAQFKLNDAQVALYQEFRAATDRSLDTMARSDMLRFGGEDVKDLADMVMDAKDAQDAAQILRDHLQMLAKENPDRAGAIGQLANGMLDRAARVQELQEQGYAPLSRFGKYTVDVVDAGGERQYFGLFETAREANIMAMKMRKGFGQDAVTQGTLSDEEFKLLAGITPESLELFGNMLGLDATGDDAQDQAFQEYLRRTKTNRSAMRRLIHRQGIAGYSEDVGRVLASFIYSNARQTSAGLHMGDLGEAITQIPCARVMARAPGMRAPLQATR